ncbi:MAG: hypothetical protein MI974_03425 [Chitinophagales bacterium]|nr:hypothetical protein [Chitinophagales bacterium]
MLQSRIIKYIKSLPIKDRERFRQFAYSPYFNQHDKTRELLDLILEAFDRQAKKLEKEKVYKSLYPKSDYDEQQLYNVMSYLKKLFHRFLAQQYFEESPHLEQLYTLEASYRNHQYDVMTNRSKQLKKKLEKGHSKDANFFYVNYRLNHLLGYYTTQYIDRSDTKSMQSMLDNLEKFYIVEKLRNCAHLVANSIMMNTSYDFRMLESVLHYLEENWEEYSDEKTIILYYSALMSMRPGPTAEHYQRMKLILSEDIQLLSEEDSRDLYNFAYNYCIQQINAGQSEYLQELFLLYKQGLRQGLLLDTKGMISEWNYKNIATLGARLQEFEWTELFLQDYMENLPSQRRENAYNYNLGNLYYNKKMYEEALSALLLVQFTDVKYHLSTTFLLLRTYYALQDTEALLSLIETFRIYVIRNRKMTTDQKRGYTNFLRFAKKLVLLKHHATTYSRQNLETKLGELRDKIENTDNIINKYWLLDECKA